MVRRRRSGWLFCPFLLKAIFVCKKLTTSADIYLVSLGGGEPKRLTLDNNSHEPVWTPDGLELVFSSKRGGPEGEWRIPVSGGGRAKAGSCSWIKPFSSLSCSPRTRSSLCRTDWRFKRLADSGSKGRAKHRGMVKLISSPFPE
ncbi:MAG: hypothetical protein DMG06_05145 [Acidobacteria bacterium]|nr:MAG: hypothetical protein DMG06_05145 [Acidobacteriota bacterium]